MGNVIFKNDWLAAGQCRTMAWHGLRDDPSAPDEASLFRMEQEREVGVLARCLYPNGVLVARTPKMTAADLTVTFVRDGSTQALFEAAFNAGAFSAKADILSREGNGWHVLEVKSSFSDTSAVSQYVDDLAYTVMVLRAAGLTVVKASLVLLSRDYRHGDGVDRLFGILDKTSEVNERAATFDTLADGIGRTLLGEARPGAVLVSACRSCDLFATRCLGAGHEHTVIELPNLHHTKLKKQTAQGILNLAAVPPHITLTDRQQRVRDSALSGRVVVDDGLHAALESIQWPCHYLDFEAMATVMPLYDGHGCHRQVLTQYSVHNRAAPDAEFGHSAFLADATRVEERQLALALIDILGQEGSIVVYSSFEKTRISALCDAYPDLKQPLSALLARLVDLHAIVINNVYHPKFKGSFSLKSVLPALVPDLSYRGLAVADGDTAITRFARMARGEIAGDGVATTRDQLLEYCRRDTLAMVRLHEVLAQMGQWTSGHAAPVVEREFL